jgi:hypothetical protein
MGVEKAGDEMKVGVYVGQVSSASPQTGLSSPPHNNDHTI